MVSRGDDKGSCGCGHGVGVGGVGEAAEVVFALEAGEQLGVVGEVKVDRAF